MIFVVTLGKIFSLTVPINYYLLIIGIISRKKKLKTTSLYEETALT